MRLAGIWQSICREAVQAALNTNPEIRQAVANKEATKEERKQAEGLWYPRISVEGSAGVRKLAQPDPPRARHRRRDA